MLAHSRMYHLLTMPFRTNASHVIAGDDPEHLPSRGLDIEERSIRVNHSGESESLHLLLQPRRIIRPQLKPRSSLRLLIRERILLPFSYSNVSEPTLKRSVLPASSSIARAREPLDRPSRFGLTSTPQAFYVRR